MTGLEVTQCVSFAENPSTPCPTFFLRHVLMLHMTSAGDGRDHVRHQPTTVRVLRVFHRQGHMTQKHVNLDDVTLLLTMGVRVHE